MMGKKNTVLKGSILVGLGAASYGMLATFVKMAYQEGFSTAEVTLSQFILGFVGLFMLSMFGKRKATAEKQASAGKNVLKLIVAGTSMGLTSVCYYMAMKYIPVSIGIVLLMQTVWMGLVVELVLYKKLPGLFKILAVVLILAGTVLATSLFEQSATIQWLGFGWGILAAISYTATMYSSNHVAIHFPPLKRSFYMILGGLIVIALIFHNSLNSDFSYGIFMRWGLLLSLFGTILPPLLFTRGMPLTGMGLGAIIAAVEVPVAIVTANILLAEPVNMLQWVGVILILFAVVLMNVKKVSAS